MTWHFIEQRPPALTIISFHFSLQHRRRDPTLCRRRCRHAHRLARHAAQVSQDFPQAAGAEILRLSSQANTHLLENGQLITKSHPGFGGQTFTKSHPGVGGQTFIDRSCLGSLILLVIKWPIDGIFLIYFQSFSNKHYNFYSKLMWKMSIQCWDSNPGPIEHEFPPITQSYCFSFF